MTATVPGGILKLTCEEYLLAWYHLDVGLVHWNLQPPGGPERTFEERSAMHRRTWEALRARRLADARHLAPELEDALRLLARPVVELNARLDLPGGRRTVVGSARGDHAVVAESDAAGLRLRPARATALPAAVAETVPDLPSGSGTAVSVLSQLLPDHHGMTGSEVERALLRGGVRPGDARGFRAMLRGPKLGGGKFGAARYDPGGTRRVAEFVVSYFATERGGYTIEQKRGLDRSSWYTIAPAGRPQLAHRLATLIDSIRI